MTAKPTRGWTFGYDQETTFGVQASPTYAELRVDDCVGPVTQYDLAQQPNLAHANSWDRSDDPLAFQNTRPGSLKFKYRARKSSASDTVAPLCELFEAAGCLVESQAKTTMAGTPTTTAIDLTADNGDTGLGALLEMSDGSYEPCITADYTTQTITPGMALSSAPSASDNAAYCNTITPYTRVVPDGKTLCARWNTRATISSGDDAAFVYNGINLESIGEITLKHGEPIIFDMTFGVAKCVPTSNAMAVESYTDSEVFALVTDDFQYCIGNAAAAGGIARNVASLIEAKLNLGFTSEFVPGVGNTSDTSGAQGAILVPGDPLITVTALYTQSQWDELAGATDGTIQHKYLAFVQPASSIAPVAIGFFFPDCYLQDKPTFDMSGNYVQSTAVYKAGSSGYESGTEGEKGMAPWYIVIGGNV